DMSRKPHPWKDQAPWLAALVNAVGSARGVSGGAGAGWNPPRCGVPDLPLLPDGPSGRNRQKRFVLSGGRWDKTNLTYKIIRFPWQLVKAKVRRTIEEALKVWSDVTPLTFTEVQEGRADIVIDFTRYWHGDNLPFDGPGGILAHAFFPKTHREGDVHFDYDETWTIGNNLGTDLLQVAAHEFGHVLGLQHTAVSKSLMSPFYIFRYPLSLSEDDKQGIQYLYGKRSWAPDPTPTPTQPAELPQPGLETNEITNVEAVQPDACHTAFDAAATIRGELFFFSSRYVWRLRAGKLQDGYPALASRHWQGIPSSVDATFEDPLGNIWFFQGTASRGSSAKAPAPVAHFTAKLSEFLTPLSPFSVSSIDSQYWIYDGERRVSGPTPIVELGLPASPVQAALVWGAEKNKIYIFSGGNYWRFSPHRRQVDNIYPRAMADWRGVPPEIDAAFQDEFGFAYFLRGRDYWKFDPVQVKVLEGYPRQISQDFFSCTPSSNSFR
ncbi:Stromelysin-3, partial [Lamprotornis superbus]